jgi:hypothetical protein
MLSTMKPFEESVEVACNAEEIPGAVLLATDRHGKLGTQLSRVCVESTGDHSLQ